MRIPRSILIAPRWRRSWRFGVVLTLIALAAFLDRSDRFFGSSPPPVASASADQRTYHDKSFRVTRVVDGDTLDINVPDRDKPTTRIRLWGVDTPEVAGSPMGEMYFGPQASAFAKEQLSGKSVHILLAPKKTRGKYGRLLAYVLLEPGGEMFNELLLSNGFAYADRRFGHPYKDQFEAIEKRARRNRIGLWAHVTTEQMPKWRQRFEKKP